MGYAPEEHFRRVESCLDYRSYIHAIDPDYSPERYARARRQLMRVGTANEERMGVVYVRGPWGFFVVPRQGYPDLRVNFFHDTPTKEINDVMASICAALDAGDVVSNRGGIDE